MDNNSKTISLSDEEGTPAKVPKVSNQNVSSKDFSEATNDVFETSAPNSPLNG